MAVTDPTGLNIVSESKPTTRSNGQTLVAGDIWIRPSDQTKWIFLSGTDWISTNRCLIATPGVSFSVPAGSTSAITSGTLPGTTTTAAGIFVVPFDKLQIDSVTIAYYSSATRLLAGSSYVFNLATLTSSSTITTQLSGAAINAMPNTTWTKQVINANTVVSAKTAIALTLSYTIPLNANPQTSQTLNAGMTMAAREII